MASGAYTAELRAVAAKDVVIVERDGRLTAFPLLLRLEPKSAAVRIGTRLNRALNPASLVETPRRAQASQAFRPAQVLERLFAVFRHMAPTVQPSWRETTPGAGPVFLLLDLHYAMTVLPDGEAPGPLKTPGALREGGETRAPFRELQWPRCRMQRKLRSMRDPQRPGVWHGTCPYSALSSAEMDLARHALHS